MTKFCKDCKWSAQTDDIYKMGCNSPSNFVNHNAIEKFLISGIEQSDMKAMLATSCLTLRRMTHHPGLGIPLCGPEGTWFEAK